VGSLSCARDILMHLSINSNPSATSASHNLSQAMDAHRKSLTRLSSGNRIVNSADDAGGLAVGNKLKARLHRMDKIRSNMQNTVSFLDMQKTAIEAVGSIITRMSELKTMSIDVIKNAADNENYNKEFVELQMQIETIIKHKFNGVSLFSEDDIFVNTHEDGSPDKGLNLARNFVFGEYVGESGAVLGQGTTTTTTSTGATSGGGAGGGGSSTTYTLDQWRADYDEWINYDDSNWDNDFLTWMADPEPYGGVALLNKIKAARNDGDRIVDLQGSNISDITPLIGLTDVEQLKLNNNNIQDLSILSGLTKLDDIKLQNNNVNDVSPLAGLVNMRELWLNNNNLEDIKPLEHLSGMTGGLGLADNNISDLSPLKNFNNIVSTTGLYLSGNPITQSQKVMLEASIPATNIFWPVPILPDPEEPETPTTTITTTCYPSLDQFATEDFSDFTEDIADALAEIGAHQSRLGFEMRNNETMQVNLESAVSALMDVDIARESSTLAQTSVKVQAASEMVAKANQTAELALRLMINR
jgi:flagellin-like hook-associated protein FlgL